MSLCKGGQTSYFLFLSPFWGKGSILVLWSTEDGVWILNI